ncbi:DUF3429 domain-containing protein [Rubrimonas sp.]|uniref:DUF3429 domain-containing protein n=1 Tax=Rubrimonas sp. TaxID=2036015 RepID=UPI002FDD4D61
MMMKGVPAAAARLGLAGLIPFVGLAALAHLAPGSGARSWLAAYGAVILSFMGGCRWGFAATGMGEGPAVRPLVLAVAPALYAWLSLRAPAPFDMELLALGLLALYLADLKLTKDGGAPHWWPALRLPLTLGATLSLLAGAAA